VGDTSVFKPFSTKLSEETRTILSKDAEGVNIIAGYTKEVAKRLLEMVHVFVRISWSAGVWSSVTNQSFRSRFVQV
jgi:hypothetical protein